MKLNAPQQSQWKCKVIDHIVICLTYCSEEKLWYRSTFDRILYDLHKANFVF